MFITFLESVPTLMEMGLEWHLGSADLYPLVVGSIIITPTSTLTMLIINKTNVLVPPHDLDPLRNCIKIGLVVFA